jgi:hypothetical protein
MHELKKKLERYFRVNLLGPGRGLTKVEKHWPTLQRTAGGVRTTYVTTSQLWNSALGACAYTDIYRCRMWTHVLWDITPCCLVNSRTLHEQTQESWNSWPWRWGNYDPSKLRLNIYQLTRIFSNTDASTSNLKSQSRNLINDCTPRLEALISSRHLIHKLTFLAPEFYI